MNHDHPIPIPIPLPPPVEEGCDCVQHKGRSATLLHLCQDVDVLGVGNREVEEDDTCVWVAGWV